MNNKSEKQTEISLSLNEAFQINPDRILFLNPRDPNDPWIPADELESIARQVGGFKHISINHDKFVVETSQVIYSATVVNNAEVSFTRPGVATVGETPNNEDIDHDQLAIGRALGAALRAAGFHPYRSGSVVDISEMRKQIEARRLDETGTAAISEDEQRSKDLKQIHAIAERKGLTIGTDDTRYRNWLWEKFKVRTAAMLDATQRAQVINKLNNHTEDFSEVPAELRDDAKVA